MPESFIQLPQDGTGKRIRTISETIASQTVHTTYVTIRTEPTYLVAVTMGVSTSNIMCILNRNASKLVKIYKVLVYNATTTVITGIIGMFELRRVYSTSALTGGTSLGALKMDSGDPTLSNVDIMAGAITTSLTNQGVLVSFPMSIDEADPSTLDADSYSTQVFVRDNYAVLSFDVPYLKPLTLRQYEGMALYVTSGSVGSIGIRVIFTYDDQ